MSENHVELQTIEQVAMAACAKQAGDERLDEQFPNGQTVRIEFEYLGELYIADVRCERYHQVRPTAVENVYRVLRQKAVSESFDNPRAQRGWREEQ